MSVSLRTLITRCIYFIGLVCLGIGSFVYTKSQIFVLKEIDVSVKGPQSQTRLFDTAVSQLKKDLSRYKGDSLLELNSEDVSALIGSHQWISRFSFSRHWPSTLFVIIETNTILATWFSEKGKKIHLLMKDGTLIPVKKIHDLPDRPVIRGDNPTSMQSLVRNFFSVLPKEGHFKTDSISDVIISKGSFDVFLKEFNFQIKLNDRMLEEKVKRVSKIVDYLVDENLNDRVIDANFSQKVLVRLRKQP